MPASTPPIQHERSTQERVLALLDTQLGYAYLGNWSKRANHPIETEHVTLYLQQAGYSAAHIGRALHVLSADANTQAKGLYAANEAVYKRLRYGIPVQVEPGQPTETVHLINWAQPEKNHFSYAQEVTLKGGHERRPDVVLYVNGIALAVLELKSSRVSVEAAIRQNLSNQQPEFNAWFFSTVQFVLAGNDSQGLRYGTVGSPADYFLPWKEAGASDSPTTGYDLDKQITQLCNKARFLELIRDFVLFDGGRKKMPRPHQYFGIKAAQAHVQQRRGGIIWHSQGAGKSILMVLLAQWILENKPHARVVIVTDRDELDKQIERVFHDSGHAMQRSSSGAALMHQLGQASPRLLCALVHKFGVQSRGKEGAHFERFIANLESQPSPTVGEVFVFVDECHRTQSGKLNRVMKALMPNAVFIGFTGTPLLNDDKASSAETFGGYIHTYLYDEAVRDKVVLDITYEARDVDQRLGSTDKVDAFFESRTKALNAWQKDALKSEWGTMQQVLSSKSRMGRVVTDICFDFAMIPRLDSGQGNAILVASSIYEACKYFELFQTTRLKGQCAVVTSYNPQAKDVALEEIGANTETQKQFIYTLYNDLLSSVAPRAGMGAAQTYEDNAKQQFIKAPAQMRLLVVVDKLLTGFDAPPCTVMYIDKSMRDHGLFQAICRTNRLDGESKLFGMIVDYKDLFKHVEHALKVYTSDLADTPQHSAADSAVLMKDRLALSRGKLDTALETLALLCEAVEPPKDTLDFLHYFCGDTSSALAQQATEPQRRAFYSAVIALLRAYGLLASELEAAGYSEAQAAHIQAQKERYVALREAIRLACGEVLDLKQYEADMRYLIDTYIEADEPRKISPFGGVGLLDLMVNTGIGNAIEQLPAAVKSKQASVAEVIENNVRSVLSKNALNDPAFYETMSSVLDEVIALRKGQAIDYEAYLLKISALATQVISGRANDAPVQMDTQGKLALYNAIAAQHIMVAGNYVENRPITQPAQLDLALKLNHTVLTARNSGWRDSHAKQQVIKQALLAVLGNEIAVEQAFSIVVQHTDEF